MLQGIDKLGNRICNCPVCQCACAIRFCRRDRVKVAQEIQRSKESMASNQPSPFVLDPQTMLQKSMDHGAMLAVRDNSEKDTSDADVEFDATAFATQHLIHDPCFQSAKAKKQLQTAIGEKKRVSDRAGGLSIHVLREQAKKAPDAFKAVYANTNGDPISACGQSDKRFFRNGLSSSKIDVTNLLSSQSNNLAIQTPFSSSTPYSAVSIIDLSSLKPPPMGATPLQTRGCLFGVGDTVDTALQVDETSNLSSPPKKKSLPTTTTTPATDLVNRTRKRAFSQTRDKSQSNDVCKQSRAVTVFTQQKFPTARELAQLQIEEEENSSSNGDDYNNTANTERLTLSQKFLETQTEYHTDYN